VEFAVGAFPIERWRSTLKPRAGKRARKLNPLLSVTGVALVYRIKSGDISQAEELFSARIAVMKGKENE
jgi:hypothetical protein